MTDCCAHEGPDSGDARFDVTKVADGVYAAVAAPAYKVNCNTAIIESDDGVVIVDTHSKPSAARVIVDRIRAITPKRVRYVINTHFHWDHWHGNEVYPKAYPGAEIVTNQITREAMRQKGSSASTIIAGRFPPRSPGSRPTSPPPARRPSDNGSRPTCAWRRPISRRCARSSRRCRPSPSSRR